MLLTIEQSGPGSEDLSWLFYKHPDKAQQFEIPQGVAHVFYPVWEQAHCQIALLLELDPVGLVRSNTPFVVEGHPLKQYVNDRPYVASSISSVALKKVFGSALAGNCEGRPEAVEVVRPLKATLSVVACEEGEALLRSLFEPLGYKVEAQGAVLDKDFPDWGASPYFVLHLEGNCTLKALLTHLYVLLPVLDNDKHYWIGKDEVEKLQAHGEGWLDTHPAKDLIMRRYLKNRDYLVSAMVKQLAENDDPETNFEALSTAEEKVEAPISLQQQRLQAVHRALKSTGARSVIDMGCGSGKLLAELVRDAQFTTLAGCDVSIKSLQKAAARLNVIPKQEVHSENLALFPSSAMYRDERFQEYEASVLMEVIEHLEPNRLRTLALALFRYAQFQHLIVTTPNVEYNVRFETLAAGQFRHDDHRFEWTRSQFRQWVQDNAEEFGYAVRFLPIGQEDPELGPPTQMAVFSKSESSNAN